ncbi:MAG: sugar-binding domain-containing protein [Phycisphaerae bacterium]|jgi:hypothetical protein
MVNIQSIVRNQANAIIIVCILAGSGFAAEKKIEQGGKDFFEAIAIESPKRQNVELHEKQPDPKPDIYVEAKINNSQTDIIKYKPMQTESEYRAELVRLKDYYKPYLRDLTPPYEKTRSRYDLTKFQFRMESADDQADITRVFRGDGNWEDANIPNYRGPSGWWRGYYRKTLTIPQEVLNSETIILHFGAVSYECDVYINNRYVGGHTGWWSPFEFDITKYVKKTGENILVVLIKNENSSIALGAADGRKIFAATSQGWNDPNTGWHHSQSGGGIWQEAYIEGRPQLHITDIFVRPDIDKGYVDAIVQVYQPAQLNDGIKMPKVKTPVSLTVDIFPNNFEGEPIRNVKVSTSDAGALFSEYSGRIKIENFRTWELKTPCLYTLRATVSPNDPNAKKDIFQTTFGMRKFTMDDVNVPKGSLYLNNKPIILRGANTMGNMTREYQEGNIDQVIEDILIAKMANMNYWRFTQTVLQPGVYSLCDRLGILTQSDLPLFTYLSRFALEEGIKQAGEMERLVRNHPCNIMISYMNESVTGANWNRRVLSRYELEEFFKAATTVVHIYNPDRVIKSIDGDFEPPAPDFPDMHCYNMWYGGWPIGRMNKGYWWPDKPGWKFGCGEYGIEGLEAAETMFKYYPKSWLPANPNDPWNPHKIVGAQTWSTHRNWFDTQETMADWINASQEHQAFGIRMQTRSFRRMKDNVSCAVHLLIDAWPAGWMKTLVDVQRIPKKAYFEFRDALTPLMVDIRTDRTRYYDGEKLNLEFWICNDDEATFKEGTIIWEVWQDDKRIFAQSCPAQIPSYSPKFAGYFNFTVPKVKERSELTIKVGLKNAGGDYVHASQMKVEVFPEFQNMAKHSALVLGGDKSSAAGLADSLGLTKVSPTLQPNPDIILVSAPNDLNSNWEMVSEYVDKGGTAVLLEQPANSKWVIGDQKILVVQWEWAHGRDFVSRKTGHSLVEGFKPFDFAYWYDPNTDCIRHIVYGYLKSEPREQKMPEFSASARKFNFAPKGVEVEGFTLSDGSVFDSAKGFGWDKDMRKTMRKRDSRGKPELITGVSVVGETKEAVFSVSLDNGEYAITPVGGDAEYASHFEIYAQDQLLVKKDVAKGEWVFETYKVNVNDGKLDVRLKIDPNRPIIGAVMNCLIIEPWTNNVAKRVALYEQASKQSELIPVLMGGINGLSVPVVAERKFGKGRFFISQITASDRVKTNPIARLYFERMISQAAEK